MSPTMMYLHGFASSPDGTKAQFIKARCEERGVHFRAPDLNVPDFEHLTLTATIERTAEEVRACPPGPIYLIGSSMGGLTAVNFLDRYHDTEAARVSKIILMAPALATAEVRAGWIGESAMRQWRETGWLAFFHYGYKEERRLYYGNNEDLMAYSDPQALHLDLPILIFHGRNDDEVPHELSIRFAEARDNVTLRLLDSDHGLWDALDVMWAEMVTFLEI